MEKLLKKGSLFLGLNYWSSRDAVKMWEHWDANVIEQDFARMREYGVTHLRVFPLWNVFQPLWAYNDHCNTVEYAFADGPLPDTEAGRAGVSEEACDHFEVLCDLAEQYGFKLVVSLVTGIMSSRYFAPPAFEGKNPLNDPTALKWQLRFIKYFVRRFSKCKAIVGWDLGNECNLFAKRADMHHADEAYIWCSAVSDAIRASDPSRPVITGFDVMPVDKDAFNAMDIAETADIFTVHDYNIFRTKNDSLLSMRSIVDGACLCKLYRDLTGVPAFLQEIGSIGYANCSEKSEAMFYRALMFSSWVYDCFGIMWWCAFDQGSIDYPPYDWNTIGSQYGFFREDLSEKPVALENKKFAELMSSLPIDALPPIGADAVCILSDNEPKPYLLMSSVFCLALQANMNLKFVHASQKMPKANAYIFPSVDQNHSIRKRRLNEILEYVKQGAVLYLSLGKGMFRELPELAGVSISYREGMANAELVTIGDAKLRLQPDFKYVIESCDAEVLAVGEDGRPVYVRHPYGKGFVYLSTVPIEKYLMNQNVVFSKNDCPDYSVWYRAFAPKADGAHVADIRSQMVRMTEHAIDDDNRYAVAINYSYEHIDAAMTLCDAWHVAEVCYGNYNDGILHVDGCDAVILKLKRKPA